MNNDNQIVVPSKKRMRRNAIKPYSVESDTLREFSILHSLDSKLDLDSKRGVEEEKGAGMYEREILREESVPEKRRKVPTEDVTPRGSEEAEFPSIEILNETSDGKQEENLVVDTTLNATEVSIDKGNLDSNVCKET